MLFLINLKVTSFRVSFAVGYISCAFIGKLSESDEEQEMEMEEGVSTEFDQSQSGYYDNQPVQQYQVRVIKIRLGHHICTCCFLVFITDFNACFE